MIGSLLLILLGALAIVLLYWTIERNAVSPKIPGPKTTPIFGNLFNGNIFRGEMWKNAANAHREFGDTIKIELPVFVRRTFGVILTTSPEFIKQIWNDSTTARPTLLNSATEYFGSESYFITDGEMWSSMRNFFKSGFSFENIQLMLPKLETSINVLLQNVEKHIDKDEPAPMHLHISRFALDNDSILSYGMPMGAQSGKFDGLFDDIWFHITNRIKSVVPYWKFYETEEKKKYDYALKVFREAITSIIATRRKQGVQETDRDFLSMMLRAQESGEFQFTEKQIVDQCFTFLNGGTDTLSSTITSMVYLLSINPEVEQKVIEEVDAVLGDRLFPDWEDMNKLKYCGYVIKEVLRMFPPASTFARKLTKTTTLGDYVIPPDKYDITVSIYALHHDPKHYPAPFKFDPERWSDERMKNPNPYIWMPFTAGPRNCQGHKLALTELKAVLSSLYRQYYFRLAPDQVIRIEDSAVMRIPELLMFPYRRKSVA